MKPCLVLAIILCLEQTAVSAEMNFAKELAENGPDFCPVNAYEYLIEHDFIPGAIPLNELHASPDGRFSVELSVKDRSASFDLRNNRTARVTHLSEAFVPVFSLSWTPDSRTAVAVAHAAQSSVLQLLHWNRRDWVQFEISVPGYEGNEHVVGWKFQRHHLQATLIVNHSADNRSPLRLYKFTFDIDPATGSVFNVEKKALTLQEYVAFRTLRN